MRRAAGYNAGMPELPEVETARRCLERWAGGRRVREVKVVEKRVVAPGGPPLRTLVGARFQRFDRRGKHLLLTLSSQVGKSGKRQEPTGLWSHLGMTGKWLRRAPGEPDSRFSRVQVLLDDGVTLHYDDMRLFGRLRAVRGAAFEVLPAIAALGPDPLIDGVDVERLAEALRRRKQPIKPVLLDQRLVAGVGNIQASESLFRAGIDPRRPAASLTRAEVRKLARGIEASIAYSLAQFDHEAAAGDIRYVEEPAGLNPFKVYDRRGRPLSPLPQGNHRAAGAGRALDVLLRPLSEVVMLGNQRAGAVGVAFTRALRSSANRLPTQRPPAARQAAHQGDRDDDPAKQGRRAARPTANWPAVGTHLHVHLGRESSSNVRRPAPAAPARHRRKVAGRPRRRRRSAGPAGGRTAAWSRPARRSAAAAASGAGRAGPPRPLEQHRQRLQQEKRRHQAGR